MVRYYSKGGINPLRSALSNPLSIYKTRKYNKHTLNKIKISVYDTCLAKEIYAAVYPTLQ